MTEQLKAALKLLEAAPIFFSPTYDFEGRKLAWIEAADALRAALAAPAVPTEPVAAPVDERRAYYMAFPGAVPPDDDARWAGWMARSKIAAAPQPASEPQPATDNLPPDYYFWDGKNLRKAEESELRQRSLRRYLDRNMYISGAPEHMRIPAGSVVDVQPAQRNPIEAFRSCHTCKYVILDSVQHPCSSCLYTPEGFIHWQPK